MKKRALVGNASDVEQVKEAAKRERIARANDKEDLRFILNSPQGRRFFWRHLTVCGIYKISADQSGSWTYYNEGKRRIALELMQEIVRDCPDLYLLMVKECQIGELNV